MYIFLFKLVGFYAMPVPNQAINIIDIDGDIDGIGESGEGRRRKLSTATGSEEVCGSCACANVR